MWRLTSPHESQVRWDWSSGWASSQEAASPPPRLDSRAWSSSAYRAPLAGKSIALSPQETVQLKILILPEYLINENNLVIFAIASHCCGVLTPKMEV